MSTAHTADYQIRESINETDLTLAQKAVFTVVARLASDVKGCFMTNSTIAKKAGLRNASGKSAGQRVAEIVKSGYLKIEEKPREDGSFIRILRLTKKALKMLGLFKQRVKVDPPQQKVETPQPAVDITTRETARESFKHAFVDNRSSRKRVTAAVMDVKNTDW